MSLMITPGFKASTFIVSSLAIGQSFIELILIVTVALVKQDVEGSGSVIWYSKVTISGPGGVIWVGGV